MRHTRRTMLINQVPGIKPIQLKCRIERMRPILRHGVGHHPARAGRGFEAASTPAAVEVQALDMRLGNDGATI